MTLRSQHWLGGDDEVGLEHRASMRAAGVDVRDGDDRPVIGILNSFSELNPCNMPLRRLATAVKQGVWAAGGVAVEVPTISLHEDLMKPTAMLYRNLMAIEVEEVIRAHPLDGVVLLGNCDKTIPAQLMGASSADIPAIQMPGGYRRMGLFRQERIGTAPTCGSTGTSAAPDAWATTSGGRSKSAMGCTQGACNVMGTAITMAIVAEALGMMLPGASTLPFDDTRLTTAAVESGRLESSTSCVRTSVRAPS